MRENLQWIVPQVVDMIDPKSPSYNERAARAKTMRKDGTWGPVTDESQVAHGGKTIEATPATARTTIPATAAICRRRSTRRARAIHFEGDPSRAVVSHTTLKCFAVTLTLGAQRGVEGQQVLPMRSASAVFVTVKDRGRNQVVTQQPTISAAGRYSGSRVHAESTPHRADHRDQAMHRLPSFAGQRQQRLDVGLAPEWERTPPTSSASTPTWHWGSTA